MYHYLQGTAYKTNGSILVVECGGVGYAVNTSGYSMSKISDGQHIKVYTYLHVREGVMDLYGFLDEGELNCFKMLISVSGIGPKVAMSILSSINYERVALCIVTDDYKSLTAAQGLGMKGAQRIVLELKDKIKKDQLGGLSQQAKTQILAQTGGDDEAVDALMVLGYTKSEASSAVRRVDAEEKSLEDIIREALKLLVKG